MTQPNLFDLGPAKKPTRKVEDTGDYHSYAGPPPGVIHYDQDGLPDRISFGGSTFDPERDGARLHKQLEIVRAMLSDEQPHTLSELAEKAQCSVASASARVRDLRKEKFGSGSV